MTVATLLLSIMAIEVEANAEVDLDQELKVNGAANAAAGLAAGTVTTLSVSRTLFGYKTGARTRGGGLLAGPFMSRSRSPSAPRRWAMCPCRCWPALLLQLGVAMLDEWLDQRLAQPCSAPTICSSSPFS